MNTRQLPPALLSCALLLSGCEPPNLRQPQVTDLAAGYRKTVYMSTDLNQAQFVRARLFVTAPGEIEKEAPIKSLDVSGDTVTARTSLLASENLSAGATLRLRHRVSFRQPLADRDEEISLSQKVHVEPQARLVATARDMCVHVDDTFEAHFSFVPRPTYEDRSALRPSAQIEGACLRPVGTANTHGHATLTFQAICEGTAKVSAYLPARPGVAASDVQGVRILPSLAPPNGLSVLVGDVSTPEDPDPSLPTDRYVTINWSLPSVATGVELRIFRVGRSRPVEQTLIPATEKQYQTLLVAGHHYSAEVRARYAGCFIDGEVSKAVRSPTFAVPK